MLTRRKVLALLGAGGSPLAGRAQQNSSLPADDAELLDEIEKRACRFFFDHASPRTGLVRDRARSAGKDDRRIASIAATGFGLSAMCIADQRSYLPAGQARQRTLATLDFLARKMPKQHGFFYHFVDIETGARAMNSELSSVDTTWLLCGVLHARAHFEDKRIRSRATEILQRVDWRWMLNDGNTLSHGWMPEKGFLPYRWDQYAELLAMYLLAMSSSTFPIPASSWDSWERPSRITTGNLYIDSPAPLFVHQYSHAWFDFRNKQDGYADYFLNSQLATAAHREFCVQLASKYPWMGPDMWGITASDSRFGYVDWGGPSTASRIDGTLVPCAAGGSVVFLPQECIKVLRTMLDRYGKEVWTQYGFVDAFHPEAKWFAPDVLGIDLGIMMMMAENQRSGSIWKAVMSTREAQSAMDAAAFFDKSLA